MAEVEGTIVFASDDGGPGGRARGNRLGVWRLETDGTWSRRIDMQPAVAYSMAVVGATLVMAGRFDDWPWIAVSIDGGRTWEEGLSWVGFHDACVGAMATVGDRIVMEGCRDRAGGTTLWVTDVPTLDVDPVASPGPEPMQSP
jgi:hypothetical protein